MNFIKILFQLLNTKYHITRGHKLARRGSYKKALFHYQLAQKHYDEAKLSPPNLLECIAQSYAKLGNYKDALLYAERSLEGFKRLEKTSPIFSKSARRVDEFISTLKPGEGI